MNLNFFDVLFGLSFFLCGLIVLDNIIDEYQGRYYIPNIICFFGFLISLSWWIAKIF